MWLLTVVGPVHGQRQFTFALEQDRTYTIGRDKNADIPVDSRRLRTKEGNLQVGHWRPDQRLTPPTILYRPEPKRSGAPSPVKVLWPLSSEAEPTDHESYDTTDYAGDADVPLDKGQGIDYGAEAWFFLQWQPLHFTNDKMKDVDDSETGFLRKYCVSWDQSFETEDPPDVVVSPLCRNTQDCNFAMCYGIPIVTPAWLQILGFRLKACWKKSADSEDSFHVPSFDSEDVRPALDPLLKNRQNLGLWRADPARRRMWSKWNVLELKKPKGHLMDARYYTAMGATLVEVDVLNPLISTPDAFIKLIDPLIARADADDRNVVVVYLPPTKTEMIQKGVDFNSVIVAACASRGINVASGSILWNAMNFGSVSKYLEVAAASDPTAQVESTPQPTVSESTSAPQQAPPSSPPAQPEPSAPKGRLPRRAAGSRSESRAPSAPPPPTAPPPDLTPSTEEDNVPTAGPSSTATRKPLKRRAGRGVQRVDMDLDDDIAALTPVSSQPSRIPETQLSEAGHSLASRVPDSMDMDTQASQPSQANSVFPSQNPPARSSRLKRRAGVAPTPSTFLDRLDTSVHYENELKKQETANGIRELYEQSKRESASLASAPPTKRPRRKGPEDIAEEEAESALPSRDSREDLMDVDEENDFVTRALRSARVKKEVVSPAKRPGSPVKIAQPPAKKVLTAAEARRARRASSEEEEPIEELKSRAKSKSDSKASSPTKRGPKATQMTKDDAFLQAITRAKSKRKEMEELDKEFNELRIPKANNKRGTDPAVRANHISDDGPHYDILNDFDDDMRGNFIEVVRKDLFRKDAPKVPQMVEDGRPNFKKFKKKNVVRREPLRLNLAAPNVYNAEMGEPYWATEDVATQPRTQPSQNSHPRGGGSFEEEDSAPLLPSSRRKLLSQIQEEGDSDDEVVPSLRSRRGKTPASAGTSRRSTRASSVQSEASAVAAPPTRTQRNTQRTQRAPAKRATQRALLVESDDDEVFATAPPPPATATGRSSRSTRSRGAEVANSSTLAAPSTRTRTSQRTTQATQRRKLLVDDDDDDDDIQFVGVQKKRRLG